jgi:type VI secretion system secreted protein VgrG
MFANAAKYLLSIANFCSKNFEVTSFSGEDAINSPYWFDISFRMSGTAQAVPPPDADVLGGACRLDIERNGETISYCGVVTEFRVSDSDDIRYVIRLAPRLFLLSLNSSSRVFRNLTVPAIIEKVVKEAELSEYFRFELDHDIVKYPKREFRVQYLETDLAFISRLMEESGIWYFFEQVRQPTGVLKECAVITDDFSRYPMLGRPIPFMRGQGLAEISSSGHVVESINSISSKRALMPKNVRVRSYDHRYPEGTPDGFGDVPGGHSGLVYEYGGMVRNVCEAEYRATLRARRLWIENSCADGKGNCASFRAGLRVPITHDGNRSLSGDYLLVSVKHTGGWVDGADTYRNEFTCIRAEKGIYAPPLRTPVPRIDGVTTARVGATGDDLPTLNEYGDYNVNMPFVLEDDKDDNNPNTSDYDGSKDIRLAQPSSGMAGDMAYGIHFPSKRGAEMVLAYVGGNPDRPLGLGFVPNAASPSVIRNLNCTENIIRSWGGSELVMDDIRDNKSVKLSTPDKRYLELHDGDELVRVKSENCELVFNDVEKYAEIDAGGHKIHIDYDDDSGRISIITVKGNVIEMNDPTDLITVQNAGEANGKKVNKIVLNGNDKSITLDCMDNTVVLNGKNDRITMESKDSKVVFDGNGKKIIMENKDNKIVINSENNSVTLDAKKDINLKAGGELVIDAKGGISNKGRAYDVN